MTPQTPAIQDVTVQKRGEYYMPGMPPFPPCWVIIMSSTRMSMMAVSDALWMDWRLDRRGSITPYANISMTLPSYTFSPAFFLPLEWTFLSSTSLSIGLYPEFSARVRGIDSNAVA